MTRPWLRLYRGIVSSPKIQRLKPEVFKAWVNMLCCTSDDGELPSVEDLAFMLRVSEQKAGELVSDLTKAGLLDKRDGSVFMHDWADHQFQSDTDPTARDRKRKQRTRARDSGGSHGSGHADVTRDTTVTDRDSHGQGHAKVTRTDTDTDTDQNRTEGVARAQARDAPPRFFKKKRSRLDVMLDELRETEIAENGALHGQH